MKILLFLVLLISKANAGGAFLYEVGIPDNGWAAAGRAAYSLDPSTVYGNPAGLSNLENSEFMVGLQPKFISMEFQNQVDNTKENDINLSMHVPGLSFFYNTKFGDKVGFGVGLLSFMGLAVDYGDYWAGKNWVQEMGVLTMDIVPAFSYKFSDKFSLGLGFDILYGKIKNNIGIGTATSNDQISFEDSTFGFGFNAGLLYNFSAKSRLGIKYRSPIGLDFESALDTNVPISPPSLKLDTTIPQEISLGLFFETSEKLSLLLGFGWQNWQKFGEFSIQNQTTGNVASLNANLENTWNVSGGIIWSVGEIEKLTFGLAYDSSAVEDSIRTVMLPMAAQFRISAGYMVEISEKRMFDFNFTFITSGDDNPVNMAAGPGLKPAITGNYDPYNIYSIGINYKW